MLEPACPIGRTPRPAHPGMTTATATAPRSVRFLFRFVALLPLRAVHALGAALARVAFALSARERRRLDENLKRAGYHDLGIRRAAVAEAGKTVLEMPWLWARCPEEVVALVRRVEGEACVIQALAENKGIIYLTPHLGCFEVAAQFAAAHATITVMYRPPRQGILEPLLRAGRARGGLQLATADMAGVMKLLKALRSGQWVGILPDQVPSRGEGEWVEFFGHPAYTMTLVPRLQKSTGAAVVLAFCERLPRGEGYAIHLEPLPPALPGESAARRINRALEALIRRCPEQYLWSYNRYKVPRGVAPPQEPAIG